MRINKNLTEERWIDFGDVRFKVRPFPMSGGMYVPGEEKSIAEFMLKKFMYVTIDWTGLEDQDGKELKCTDENKKFIFDFVPEIHSFISGEAYKPLDNIVEKKTT